jgi:hypothetical protein
VFDYLADACHQPAWRASVKRARQTRGSAAGLHSAYELTRTLGVFWRPVTAELELVTYEPPQRLGWAWREGAITAEIQCELEPLAGAAVVWYSERLDGPGHGLLGLLDLPLRRYQLPRDLWRLKRILEETERPTRRDQCERAVVRRDHGPGAAASA